MVEIQPPPNVANAEGLGQHGSGGSRVVQRQWIQGSVASPELCGYSLLQARVTTMATGGCGSGFFSEADGQLRPLHQGGTDLARRANMAEWTLARRNCLQGGWWKQIRQTCSGCRRLQCAAAVRILGLLQVARFLGF